MRIVAAIILLLFALATGAIAFVCIHLFENEIGRPLNTPIDSQAYPELHFSAVTPEGFVAITQKDYPTIAKKYAIAKSPQARQLIDSKKFELFYLDNRPKPSEAILYAIKEINPVKKYSPDYLQDFSGTVIKGTQKQKETTVTSRVWDRIDNIPAFSYTLKMQYPYNVMHNTSWFTADRKYILVFGCTSRELNWQDSSRPCRSWIQSIRLLDRPKWYQRLDYANPVRVLVGLLGLSVISAVSGLILFIFPRN